MEKIAFDWEEMSWATVATEEITDFVEETFAGAWKDAVQDSLGDKLVAIDNLAIVDSLEINQVVQDSS